MVFFPLLSFPPAGRAPLLSLPIDKTACPLSGCIPFLSLPCLVPSSNTQPSPLNLPLTRRRLRPFRPSPYSFDHYPTEVSLFFLFSQVLCGLGDLVNSTQFKADTRPHSAFFLHSSSLYWSRISLCYCLHFPFPSLLRYRFSVRVPNRVPGFSRVFP